MVKIAQELASSNKCWALLTGDSLGQVASQTAGNISVVDEAATLPFLRPLIGMDKIEITDQAQRSERMRLPLSRIRIVVNYLCRRTLPRTPILNRDEGQKQHST